MKSAPPLERFHAIVAAITKGKATAVTLARQLETSSRTIHRDLVFMRERLHIPLEYDGSQFSWKLTQSIAVCAVCASVASGVVAPAPVTTTAPAPQSLAVGRAAAEALLLLEAEAKERMGKGRPKEGVEQVPQDNGKARDKAAEIAGVNPHYVRPVDASIAAARAALGIKPSQKIRFANFS